MEAGVESLKNFRGNGKKLLESVLYFNYHT
jgi:hypothetical protein